MDRSMVFGKFSTRAWRAALGCAVALVLAHGAATAQDPVTVRILSPVSEETIYNNGGHVPVRLELSGRGGVGAHGRVRVLLDGRSYGADLEQASFVLENVERGEHELQVQIIDRAGEIIATSAAVKFHMWRASALFPGRKPPR
jgi:hypothetical protein